MKATIKKIRLRTKLMFIYTACIAVPFFLFISILLFSILYYIQDKEQLLLTTAVDRIENQVNDLFDSFHQVAIYQYGDMDLQDQLKSLAPDEVIDIKHQTQAIEDKIDLMRWSQFHLDSMILYQSVNENITGEFIDYLDEEVMSQLWYERFKAADRNFLLMSDMENGYMTLTMISKVAPHFPLSENYVRQTLGRPGISTFLIDSYFTDNSRVYLVDEHSQIVASNQPLNEVDPVIYQPDFHGEATYVQRVTAQNLMEDWEIIVVMDQPQLTDSIVNLLKLFAVVLSILFVIAFFVIRFYTMKMLDRLSTIGRVMEDSHGKHLIRIEGEIIPDEIGVVANSYNRLIDNLQRLLFEQRLSHDRAEKMLEEKVNAFKQLEAVNKELTIALEKNRIQNLKITELIYRDSLTGLSNRFSITNTIGDSLAFDDVSKLQAVIFVDVDNFKYINDTHGHDVGDLVIKETGRMLMLCERQGLTIGRFGGDEFLLHYERFESREEVEVLLQDIQRVFKEAMTLSGIKFFLTLSIGVSMYPLHGITANELIKKADLALYSAKNLGKDRYVFYSRDIDENLERRLVLQETMRGSEAKEIFYLNYQPYVDAASEGLTGFEALIRWKHPVLGQIPPNELIDIAEEIGAIIPIGYWIIETSCLFIKEVNKYRDVPLTISINISPLQLKEPTFMDKLNRIVAYVGVERQWLILEMTEKVLIESVQERAMDLQKMISSGYGIALDDFGTGYSSLSYFRDLPVTILKIDKTFIDEVAYSEHSQNLIKVILFIARSKGILVTAEGVEDKEQLDMVKQLGCNTIQGYYFSRPLDEQKAIEYSKLVTGSSDQ